MAKNIEKDLLKLAEEMKMVAKRIEALSEKFDKLETATPSMPITVKKKAPAKKKAAAEKPSSKKAERKTDRDIVLGFIQRAKKGINSAALVRRSGFNPKKIANIVFQLKKRGKIKSPERGVYSKA